MTPGTKKDISVMTEVLLNAGFTMHDAQVIISVMRNAGLSIIEIPKRLKKVNAPGFWWVKYCQLPNAVIQEIIREPSGLLDHCPLFGDLDDIDWVEPVIPPMDDAII